MSINKLRFNLGNTNYEVPTKEYVDALSFNNGTSNTQVFNDTPIGTIISYMGTTAPRDYLSCNGATYNISDYTDLANFFETQFGSKNYFGGDGVDTFAVPDLRGEFLRGSGTNSHTNQGRGSNVGTHQDATSIPYAGTYVDGSGNPRLDTKYNPVNNTPTIPRNTDSEFGSSTYTNNRYYIINKSSSYEATQTVGTDSYTLRPTNTSVLYCIKYTLPIIPELEDGTPVGRVVFDCILRDGYIKANGQQISNASNIVPRLLSFVQRYSNQILAQDQATYNANVGLYMYDSNNDILTLPNYIGRFMEGGNSIESIEAGLPNIKGTIPISRGHTFDENPTGAVYNISGIASHQGAGGAGIDVIYGFNAHNSNSIYADSNTTVQPPAITLIPQIRY